MLTPAIRRPRLATDHFKLTETGAAGGGDNELRLPFPALVLSQKQRLGELHRFDARRQADGLQRHRHIAHPRNDRGLIDPVVAQPGLPPEAQTLGMNALPSPDDFNARAKQSPDLTAFRPLPALLGLAPVSL